ncbi:MAG: hypothetical protein ACRD2Z_08640 [Thermoanaerobaculia bacterium]
MSEMRTPSGRDGRFAPPADALGRLERRAWIIGALGAVGCLIAYFVAPKEQFLKSWLVAWLFWFSIALGSLALAMVHHLSRGAWGLMARRIWEAAFRTLPLVAVLFLPILLDLPALYEWARPEVVAGDEILQHKAGYLNVPFFLLRTGLYFLIWVVLAWLLARMSARQDEAPGEEARLFTRMQRVSSGGALIYVLTLSFAAIDWVMSLDPHWFSSIWGAYLLAGQGVAALAFLILVGNYLAQREPLAGVLRPEHFHDYGKLLFAFTMLWGYFAVSQYLIIWSGNLPEEITWFLKRREGAWLAVSVLLALAHFFIPFLLLLSRGLKRHSGRLAAVVLILLVARWLDFYWQVAPNVTHGRLGLTWIDAATLVGIGGLWLGLFFRLLSRRSLLPVRDPYLEEALQHG